MNNLINGGNRRHFAKGGVSTCRPQRKGIKTTRRYRSQPAGTPPNAGEEGSDGDSPPPPAQMLNRGPLQETTGQVLGNPYVLLPGDPTGMQPHICEKTGPHRILAALLTRAPLQKQPTVCGQEDREAPSNTYTRRRPFRSEKGRGLGSRTEGQRQTQERSPCKAVS